MKYIAFLYTMFVLANWPNNCFAAEPDPHLLVVATTSLATAVVFCRTKHGDFDNERGRDCFLRARDVLVQFSFEEQAATLRGECPKDANFNTCLTPKVANLAAKIIEAFKRADL